MKNPAKRHWARGRSHGDVQAQAKPESFRSVHSVHSDVESVCSVHSVLSVSIVNCADDVATHHTTVTVPDVVHNKTSRTENAAFFVCVFVLGH